jgi:hypothetical protein
MAGCPHEPEKILTVYGGGGGIGQWVAIDRIKCHQRLVYDHRDEAVCIVDQLECRHRSRRHSQDTHKQVWLAERKPAAAKDLVQTLQVHGGMRFGDHKK